MQIISSQHSQHENHLDICGAAVVSRGRQAEWGGGECKLYIIIIQFEILRGILLLFYMHENQCIAMLHSSIGIGTGYWYC